MNSFNVDELIHKFQNLIIQNRMSAFRNFKKDIHTNFVVFSEGQLEKIFAFIEAIQKHPKRCALDYALKPMFKMLLETMINQNDVVSVLLMKTQKKYNIEFKNIATHFKKKKIIRKGNKSYIIPYKPDMSVLKKREIVIINTMFYNSIDSFNLYEHEQDKNCDD